MAYIGSSSISIGSNGWYIGSWYNTVTSTNSDYFGIRDEDLWVYYDENDNVITELNFDSILPDNSVGQIVKARYRGFNPIKIAGFYITEMESPYYNGSASPVIDKDLLIEWADNYTGGDTPPGTPGLEIQFDDFSTGLPVITQVESNVGDSRAVPIIYTGHENGILRQDDLIELTIRITVPDDSTKEILAAGKFHFGVEISFIEIPQNLIAALLEE